MEKLTDSKFSKFHENKINNLFSLKGGSSIGRDAIGNTEGTALCWNSDSHNDVTGVGTINSPFILTTDQYWAWAGGNMAQNNGTLICAIKN